MKLIRLFDNNVHVDSRGQLIELRSNNIRKNMKHMFISYTHPDSSIIRGNHYHKYKNEWFYIIQGKMKIKVKDLKSGMTEEHIFDDSLKKFIQIGPNLPHSFQNIGKDVLILMAIVDRKFNKQKPDTYAYET
jgi:dTDP-4-dehydrorhamnose 3,5-epimerase-like enzyme